MWTSPSGKSYVGQAESLEARKTVFLCEKAYYAGSKLQAARKKYPDFSLWKYEVLEYCALNELDDRETFWISYYDTFHNGYNMTKGGGGARGAQISEETREKQRKAKLGTKMSDSAKEKMSLARKGKKKNKNWIEKIANSHRGKKMSNEAKIKMSKAQIKAHAEHPESYYHSETTKQKIKEANLGIVHETLRLPILQYSLEGVLIKEWECASVAAKTLGFNASPMAGCLKGKTKTYRGFQWKYKNNNSTIEPVEERKCKAKKIIMFSPEGEIVKKYHSVREAVLETGIGKYMISKCLKNPEKTTKLGFRFEYAS